MGIAERKEKQKHEIRKMILDASIKLFIDEGFENVTIRKIADIIEYSPTTIYLYFKDKNEIFYSLHEIGFQKMDELNANLRHIRNPLTRLYKMGENYIEFGLLHPEYYDIMFIQRAPMKVLAAMENCDWKYGESALHTLMATVDECIGKGYIPEGNTQAVSMGIWGMVHGLVSLQIRERFDKLDADDKNIKNLMLQSLNWLIGAVDKKR